jgi:hypothetical protein
MEGDAPDEINYEPIEPEHEPAYHHIFRQEPFPPISNKPPEPPVQPIYPPPDFSAMGMMMGTTGNQTEHPGFQNEDLDFYKMLLSTKEVVNDLPTEMQPLGRMISTVQLTNLTESKVKSMKAKFQTIKTMNLMSRPPGSYTWSKANEYGKLEFLLDVYLNKSIGGFERRLLATSISESHHSTDLTKQGVPQAGGGVFGTFSKFAKRG